MVIELGKWKPELWTTYRGNNNYPIYNWFYFTEAYSRGIVNKYIKKYNITGKILDSIVVLWLIRRAKFTKNR